MGGGLYGSGTGGGLYGGGGGGLGMMGGAAQLQQQQAAQAAAAAAAASTAANAADSVILEEEFDPDYEPTEEEIIEYAQFLQMDLVEDRDLFWIAREGLKAPLPAPWKRSNTLAAITARCALAQPSRRCIAAEPCCSMRGRSQSVGRNPLTASAAPAAVPL